MKSPIGPVFLIIVCASAAAGWSSRTSFRRQTLAHLLRPRRERVIIRPMQMALFSDFSSLSTVSLSDYQLVTESAASGLLCGTADALAQARERLFGAKVADSAEPIIIQRPQREPVDIARIGRFAVKGLIGGIIWSIWFGIVDGWSTDLSLDALSNLGSWLDSVGVDASWIDTDITKKAGRVVTAMVLEQCIASPLIFACWDLPLPLLLSGTPINEIPHQVYSKIGPLLISNAKVWSIANLVVYSAPLEWRVVVMSTVDLFWQSVIAASVASKEADPENILSATKVEGTQDAPPVIPLDARI